jgi:hypothetical protein
MVHLHEEENRVYYIRLLKYVVQELLHEVVEADDDKQVELVGMFDNDAYHQVNNELPLEVDNNF